MKRAALDTCFVATTILMAFVPARAQFIPGLAEQRTQETFQVMQKNVAQISEPVSEKERWQANVSMWRTVLEHLNDTQNTNTKLLKDTLQIMEGNVSHITQASERERWDDNLQLWRRLIARYDDPRIIGLAEVDHALGEMDANVCCIAEPHEHERWQANHDLWQLLIARWANEAMPKPRG
jgi:hypothetical protein